MFNNYKDRLKHFIYTFKHIIAINKCAYKYNLWNISYLFHDMDKLFMYLFYPLNYSTKDIHKIHRMHSKHHVEYPNKDKINWEMVIMDWECARYTKPDKPLNAYDTLIKYYSDYKDICLPILEKIKLI